MYEELFAGLPISDFILIKDQGGYSAAPSKEIHTEFLIHYDLTYKHLRHRGYDAEDADIMAAELVTEDLIKSAELNEIAFSLTDRDREEARLIKQRNRLDERLREVRSEPARGTGVGEGERESERT